MKVLKIKLTVWEVAALATVDELPTAGLGYKRVYEKGVEYDGHTMNQQGDLILSIAYAFRYGPDSPKAGERGTRYQPVMVWKQGFYMKFHEDEVWEDVDLPEETNDDLHARHAEMTAPSVVVVSTPDLSAYVEQQKADDAPSFQQAPVIDQPISVPPNIEEISGNIGRSSLEAMSASVVEEPMLPPSRPDAVLDTFPDRSDPSMTRTDLPIYDQIDDSDEAAARIAREMTTPPAPVVGPILTDKEMARQSALREMGDSGHILFNHEKELTAAKDKIDTSPSE